MSYKKADNIENSALTTREDPNEHFLVNTHAASELSTPDDPQPLRPIPSKRFLFLKKKPDVSGFNVSSFFLIQFAAAIVLTFMNQFLSNIVRSPEYYNIPKNESGRVIGNLAFYTELTIIPMHFILGAVMDAFGRKYPTVIGLLIAGVCIISIPYGHVIYPDLCVMR